MTKCQYNEYQSHSNLPKYSIDCPVEATYEKDGKHYCYFHYLRLFFTQLHMKMDEDGKKQIRGTFSEVFKNNNFLFMPLVFYNKFNELLNNYQGDELDISSFVFPIEESNNNERIELTDVIKVRRDNITIKSQYIDFYDGLNTKKYFSNQNYSSTSLNSGGTIIFQNINCNNYIFKQYGTNHNTLMLKNCTFITMNITEGTQHEENISLTVDIKKCTIDTYNHNPIISSIAINNSNITNIQNNIKVSSFSLVDSTISSPFTIEANSIKIENADLGSATNILDKISLLVPFTSINLNNNILKDPLFSYVNRVEIIDTAPMTGYLATPTGYFQNVDMQNIIFYDSKYKENKDNQPNNLKKINFVNCKFNKGHTLYTGNTFLSNTTKFIKKIYKGIFISLKKVYIWIKNKIYKEEVAPKRLEYSYLYFKELYEREGEHIASSDFYYNYLDIKRRIDDNLSFWDKFFLLLYGWFNGYNTKPERAIIWLFVIILLASTALFYIDGFTFVDTKIDIKDKVHKCIAAAILGLIPLKSLEMIKFTNLWSFLIILSENILSPVLIALFTLALRTRFKRMKKESDDITPKI